MASLRRTVNPDPDVDRSWSSTCKPTGLLLPALILGSLISAAEVSGQDQSEVELINFAFSNYLGTGFYGSDSGNVFILKVPLSTSFRPLAGNEPGWVINYPVSIGAANFDEIDGESFPDLGDIGSLDNVPDLNDIGTLSVIPGIEYRYPVSPDWQLIPFFDLGIARDLDSGNNIRVMGAGVKSFVNFDFGENWLILGNRLLFAEQESFDRDTRSNFAVFETGLDYIIPTDFTMGGSKTNLSFYFINYYYLDDLVLLDVLDARLSLENKNELGFTVSLPNFSWLPENSRLGFGVQETKNEDLYRLVFGAPFF